MQPTDELIGQRVDDYYIMALVGQGAMAKVYRAIEQPLERTVALKIMNVSLLADPTFARRFLQEARAIAALHHPNILPIYNYGEWQNRPYIATNLMEGGTLQQRLQREGQLELNDTVDIIAKLGSALEEAHSYGIVHRDLKPSNVLLDQHNQPVLADFGIAKIINSADVDNLTSTGVSLGTPNYMSPEQATGTKVDRRSDIYSLGVMLYRLLCGRLPFERESALATLIAHSREIPPPPRQYNPNIPAKVEAVVLRSLEKDPALRYQTAAGMVSALQQAIGQSGRVTPQPMPPLNPVPTSDVTPDPVPASSSNDYFHELPYQDVAYDAKGKARPNLEEQEPTAVVTPNPFRRANQQASQNFGNPLPPPIVEPDYAVSYPAKTSLKPRSSARPKPGNAQKSRRPGWLIPLVVATLALILLGGGVALLLGLTAKTSEGNPPATVAGSQGRPVDGRNPVLIFGMVENGKWEVYSAKPDGTNLKKLTNGPADNLSPSLSPDGKTLLYVAAGPNERWQIHKIGLDGSGDTVLTPGNAQNQYPAWSPDGKQIVFSSNRETGSGSFRLFVMNADGSNLRRLNTDNAGYSSWTPRNSIVYSYYTGSTHGLRRTDPDGGNTVDLTASDPAEYDFPVWSPDGKRLVVVRGLNAERAIYLINAEGGGLTRLSPPGETATNPAWSPDGKQITYLVRVGADSAGRDRWELAQIEADGKNNRRLTNDGRQKFYLIEGAI